VVFVLDGERLWATTARRTVKAREWRRDPLAAGLVLHGDAAVTFRGRVTLYDALDPFTWPASILRGPALVRASTRFTAKNARFFAGYARDAYRVPLSWTPPGRVVVSIDLEHGAVLSEGRVDEAWGEWSDTTAGQRTFRASPRSRTPDLDVPEDLRDILGAGGPGALAIEGAVGPAVLPVRWTREEGGPLAVLPRPVLALAGPAARAPAALVLDRASSWRAARMRGVLLRGEADVFLPGDVQTGGETLLRLARGAGELPPDPAVVRVRARDAVWWHGWTSGTVGRP
jgi:hypothetical protein